MTLRNVLGGLALETKQDTIIDRLSLREIELTPAITGLGAGATWTSDPIDLVAENAPNFYVSVVADQATAVGGLQLQFSDVGGTDENNWITDPASGFTFTPTVAGQIGMRRFPASSELRYFRLRIVGGATAQGIIRAQMLATNSAMHEPQHRLDDVISADRSVFGVTKSALTGKKPNNKDFDNVPLDHDGKIEVAAGRVGILSGAMSVENIHDDFGVDFSDVVPPDIASRGCISNRATSTVTNAISTTQGSGTVTITDLGSNAVANDFINIPNYVFASEIYLEGEYEITNVIDTDTYEIETGQVADVTATIPDEVTIEYRTESTYAHQHKDLGTLELHAGASSGAYVTYRSKDLLYRPGHDTLATGTVAFITPPTSTNGQAFFGPIHCYDTALRNGYAVGYNEDQGFGVFHLENNTETFIPLAQCNGDISDGFLGFDPTLGNDYTFVYGWHGYSPVEIYVLNGKTRKHILIHRFDFTNLQITPHIPTPRVPISYAVRNGTAAEDVVIRGSSFRGGVVGGSQTIAGKDYTGVFRDVRLGEHARDYNNEQSILNPLQPNERFIGKFTDVSQHGSILALYFTDEAHIMENVRIEWSDDGETPNGGIFGTSELTPQTINGSMVWFYRGVDLLGKYYRLVAVNGDQVQTGLSGSLALLKKTPFSSTIGGLEDEFNILTSFAYTRGLLSGHDGLGNYLSVGANGGGEPGLNSHIVAIEPEIDVGSCRDFATGQINAVSSQTTQIPTPAGLPGKKAVSLTNMSDTTNVFWGAQNITENTGDVILPLASKDIGLTGDNNIYVVAAGTGNTSSFSINGSSVPDSLNVTNPNNVLTSNDIRATFDTTNGYVDVTGFSGSGVLVLDSIASVELILEAQKQSGAQTETVAFVDVKGVVGNGVSTVQSPTVIKNSEHFYIVSVSRRNTSSSITSITNTMGFSGYEEIFDVSNNNESRTTIFKMTGAPIGDGTITANFNTNSEYCVMTVTRFSGVDLNDPIYDSSTYNNANDDNFAGTLNGIANAMVYMTMGNEIVTLSSINSPVGTITRYSHEDITNNEQSHYVFTYPVTTNDPVAYDITLTGIGDVTFAALGLRPSPAKDPVIRLSYSIAGIGQGATTGDVSVSSFTDSVYSVDVTSDRSWTANDIDNLTVKATGFDIGNAAALVDLVGIRVVESGGIVRVSYVWLGDVR